jgi:hypothetical protein
MPEYNGRKFDWYSHHDPRSRGYAVRDELGDAGPRTTVWKPGPILDQGPDGACTGFGWTGEALASPVRVDLARVKAVQSPSPMPSDFPYLFAMNIYHRAQQLDEWPGEAYEGSSVNGAAKAMREANLVKEWQWCFGVNDVALAISWRGPVVLGIPWLEDMFHPNQHGYLSATGNEVGGHCLLANAYYVADDAFGLVNSWGAGWGNGGQALITREGLDKLLKMDGEAALATKRSYGR